MKENGILRWQDRIAPVTLVFVSSSRGRVTVSMLLLAGMLAGISAEARAQRAITITATHDLTLGSISRSGNSSVRYSDNGAAGFSVTGDILRRVRLTVSISSLSAQGGKSSQAGYRVMAPVLTNANCAYSLDGGFSWNTFTTGTLYHETTFPLDLSTRSTILVRIGSAIASHGRQQRGNYSGKLTLVAEYR